MQKSFLTKLLSGVALCGWLLGSPADSAALERVNLHVSGSGSPFPLIYRIGQEKGFYEEEGLEVLSIAANLLTGIQGLAAGSFDFSQILGQGSVAILRGFPLKIVMAFDKEMKGVKAILTAAGVPEKKFGLVIRDEHIFTRERGCYAGDAIAATAALDEEARAKAVD